MRYSKKIRAEIYKILATTNCNVTKLCKLISIDRSTYYKWYNDNEEFQKIVKSSRAEFRNEKRENVISALYRRATGYMVTEIRETIKVNAEGEQIEKKIVTHKKYVRPSEKAIKYLLENFDENGYELFDNNDDEISIDDDDTEEEEIFTEENDIDDDDEEISIDEDEEDSEDDDDENEDYEDIETYPLSLQDTDVQGTQGVRQVQVDSINAQIESEIAESQVDIIPISLQNADVDTQGDPLCHHFQWADADVQGTQGVIIEIKPEPEHEMSLTEMITAPQIEEHKKLRRAVALVISQASEKRQKEVKEAIENSAVDDRDFMIGLPNYYARRVAKWIYEEKRNEYRKKHKLPDEYLPLKPYPVAFYTDKGTRRMNESYRERMHDIPIIEEAKALKKYIIAAQMERYYEGNIIMHKFYYANIWE